jgi:hypothetical protein
MNPDNINPNLTQASPTVAADDLREPTKEEILEDLRIALRDAITGKKGIPAREGLEAMRQRIYDDAENR